MKESNSEKSNKTVSVRIDTDIYEYFQQEEIPVSMIVRILLKGFAASEDKLGLLTQCLENDQIIPLNENEKKINAFAKEHLNTSLWTEEFIKLYRDLKQLK